MSAVRAIEFENNRFKVCYSGQLLKGNVNIFFPVPTHVRGSVQSFLSVPLNSNVYIPAIYLTFVGKGFCKWYTGSGRRSGRMTGSKTYLDERIYLLNRSDGLYNFLVVTLYNAILSLISVNSLVSDVLLSLVFK